LTADQRREIQKLAAIDKPIRSVQEKLIGLWLKSYMTPYAFARTCNIKYDKIRRMIEKNSSFVKSRIRAMLKGTITTLYNVNHNRVETLVDISNNRLKSKQDLMKIIQTSSAELLDQYNKTEDQKEKDEILYKAGNLLNLIENIKDEDTIFIRKLAELYNMDLLKNDDENISNEKIEVDEKIIKYIEEKK
jgi:hypothetical protein